MKNLGHSFNSMQEYSPVEGARRKPRSYAQKLFSRESPGNYAKVEVEDGEAPAVSLTRDPLVLSILEQCQALDNTRLLEVSSDLFLKIAGNRGVDFKVCWLRFLSKLSGKY